MTDDDKRTDAARLDVAAILEGLRADVRARRMAQGRLEQSPLERDLQRSLDEIELYRVVSAHWPLTGRTLSQRAVALVNKVVRRYLRWYINPIVEQQNAYNDAVARALRLLADAYVDLGEQLAAASHGDSQTGSSGGTQADSRGAGQLLGENPDALVGELQARVQARAADEPPARFPDLELRAVEPQLRLREQVSAHWPLGGATRLARLAALANKLVRRYLRWYVNPIVEQQNAANAAYSAALLALVHLDAERRAQVAAFRAHERRAEGDDRR